jgi:hypothetical protein
MRDHVPARSIGLGLSEFINIYMETFFCDSIRRIQRYIFTRFVLCQRGHYTRHIFLFESFVFYRANITFRE